MNKLLYILPIIFIGCSSPSEKNIDSNVEITTEIEIITEDTDTLKREESTEVTVTAAEDYTETAKAVGDNVVEGKKTKEVKMESVSFCDCVKKQHDIDVRMEDAEEDALIESLMKEMDDLSKGACKALLTETQTTPEQREERKQRIEKCLAK